jgi:hypothetical protein
MLIEQKYTRRNSLAEAVPPVSRPPWAEGLVAAPHALPLRAQSVLLRMKHRDMMRIRGRISKLRLPPPPH